MITPTTTENDEGSGRYRRIVERDTKLMDGFAERLGHMETDSASTRSDIKSLYNLVENIAVQMDRMVDRTRPNTMGFFAAALSVCMLMATIGVLAFAPVYRTLDNINIDDRRMQSDIQNIQSTRFTPDDAQNLKNTHDRDLDQTDERLSERIYRNEQVLIDLLSRTATVEGQLDRD